jgi:hypothetical protein
MSGGGPVGICRLPSGCKPNGDVCKLATMSCNSSCDCAGNCEQMDTCKQGNMGVPRCTGAQCVGAGSACASTRPGRCATWWRFSLGVAAAQSVLAVTAPLGACSGDPAHLLGREQLDFDEISITYDSFRRVHCRTGNTIG